MKFKNFTKQFPLNPPARQFAVQVVGIVLVAVVAGGGFVLADDSLPDSKQTLNLQKKASHLVEELRASDLRSDKNVADQIIELGPEALPYLPEPNRSQPLRMRATLERVRRKLQKQKSVATLQVSMMSFTGSTTIRQLLVELESQTENDLDWNSVPKEILESKAEVKFQETTFWSVINWLEEEVGLKYHDVGKLVLSPKHIETSKVRVQQGPLQVEYGKPKQKKLIGQPDEILWRVPVRIQFEPRLRPLYLRWKGDAFTALGIAKEKTIPLEAYNPVATIELSAEPEQQGLKTQLDFVGAKHEQIDELKIQGKFELILAAGHEEVMFDLSRENKSAIKRVGSAFVELIESKETSVEENQKQSEDSLPTQQVVLRVRYSPRVIQAFESHRTWMFYDPVWLKLGDGQLVQREQLFETINQYPGEITVGYRFSVPRAEFLKSTLVYRIPTLVTKLKLDISPVSLELR